MQSNHKHIYKMTAQKTGKSEQVYKDIGDFVFTNLYSLLRRPKSIIIKLRGVGTWYLRRRRMDAAVRLFPSLSKDDKANYEDRKIVNEIFIERLKEYEQYVAERNAIRQIRYGTQTLLKPQTDEE